MKATMPLFCLLVCVAYGAAQDASSSSALSLTQRAEAGDAKAQYELGRAYEEGNGVAQDDVRAVEWFRKSADQGNAQAQNSLGVMYSLGRGVPRDKEEAVRWYRKAAKQGLSEAIYNVAISYYNGEGVDESMDMAYTWMMLAHRNGDTQAAEALGLIGDQLHNRLDRSKFNLAEMYEKGKDVAPDLPAALALYREVAVRERGEGFFFHTAQYKLCEFYAGDKGVPPDYAQARAWCKRSESPQAYIVLGRLAEKGLGQEKNLRKAGDLYRNAALAGVFDGYLESGRLKVESGSHKDQKNAYFWFYLAAHLKVPGAEAKLQEAAAHLTEKEIAEMQKQGAAWENLSPEDRKRSLKKH